jgi:hypothetical protein
MAGVIDRAHDTAPEVAVDGLAVLRVTGAESSQLEERAMATAAPLKAFWQPG